MEITHKARAGGCCRRLLTKAERETAKTTKGEGEAYCPDAEKGWKAGQTGKDDSMDSQGGVGQEKCGIKPGGFHI